MKKLEDFADDINKCSKCGLCQSVCPVYKVTGNDCAVSRGKFVMLDGVLKGDLKLNKNIEKYLDLCLKCGKCKEFCPSDIDVCRIIECAKHQCAEKDLVGKFIFFLESKFVFGNILKFGRFIKTKLFNVKTFENNSLNSVQKLLYFRGCVNQVNPYIDTAIKKILKNSDIEIIEKEFDCCGLPFLSSGNLKRFEEAALTNLKKIKETEYDYFVTDCASCAFTINNYQNYFDDAVIKNQINLADFISQQNIKFKFNKHIKVTFHKPCHLTDDDFFVKLIAKCENVEYIQMDDYDECCGLAGEFAIKNKKISRQISAKKVDNAIKTDADYLLTTCPACVLGLYQGAEGKVVPLIKTVIEFLADADEIINY